MKSNQNILVRLFKLGAEKTVWFYSCILISILLSISSTIKPLITSKAIDVGILEKNESFLIQMLVWITILTFLEVVLQYVLILFSNLIAQDVIYDLRMKLYKKLIYFKTAFFDRTSNGVLVTRSVSDIETIATVYKDGILMMFGDILRIIFVLIAMFYENWILAIISFMILPVMYFITRFFQKTLKKVFADERNATARLNSFVQERLSGMSIIQLFNRQKIEFKKFESINSEVTKAYLKTVFYFSLFFPIVELISSVAIGFVIFTGALMLNYKLSVSAGEIIAFVMFINMLMRPIRQIADRFNQIQRGVVGAERVLNLIDSHEELNNSGTIECKKIDGTISFQNVHFSYIENEEILKGISFDVKKGQTIAIVGTTGAGKSTIINLLSRFYDISSGKILIDGISVKEYKLSAIRSQIAVVLQDVFLFNSSILENITFGDKNISIEEVIQAAKEIEVHDFIMSLPDGYNHKVSERGNSMSLGQRQLISFLRAYLVNPSILVLDEATSSVDTITEEFIQKATEKLTQNRTSIIIAHRLATVQQADKILVLNKGKIVEQGTHTELLKNNSTYFNLYQSQFTEDNELVN
ncbi:MAG: ABC transporter ATP-binding protein [Flavobacteriales bacterium]|nr:ABC transporter ATP-binding protein [Flavobacteriales bacterium]